jgi:Xaa-Pro aminopeptidase
MFDTGSTFDGYFSDFDRYVAFGRADEEARRAYETVWAATEAGLAVIRPGTTTSDLWQAMGKVLENGGPTGGSAGSTPGGSVGRMGHGLGMQVTEWPSNTADDDTVLVEGMVLTLEPSLTWAPGCMMVHEENLVVRADGPELLSRRAPAEMPVIG